jgi:hypothetical protein
MKTLRQHSPAIGCLDRLLERYGIFAGIVDDHYQF